MTLTLEKMNRLKAAYEAVAVLSMEQIVAAERKYPTDTPEAFSALLSELAFEAIRTYRSVAVDVAAGGFDDLTDLGVSANALDQAGWLSLSRVSGLVEWVAGQSRGPDSAMRKIGGIAQKLVLEGPRSYTEALAAEHEMTTRRYVAPGACEWCRYIAVQEHRYGHHGSEWVTTNKHDLFHEHCRCVLIPEAEFITPEYYERWDSQVDEASRLVGSSYGANTWRDHLAAMRVLEATG